MFCFKAGVFLDELKNYSPEIAFENNLIRIKHEDMANIPEDYGKIKYCKSNSFKYLME